MPDALPSLVGIIIVIKLIDKKPIVFSKFSLENPNVTGSALLTHCCGMLKLESGRRDDILTGRSGAAGDGNDLKRATEMEFIAPQSPPHRHARAARRVLKL